MKDEFYFGKTSELVKKSLEYVKSGRVLDIGARDGRNSLFLAENGFEVTAVEISKESLNHLNKFKKEKNIKITSINSNICDYKFGKYDLIISIAVFHFMDRFSIMDIISKMKKSTNLSGLNVISAFTIENPSKNFKYLFDKEELKNFYLDWEILYYDEIMTPFETHGDGKKHRHSVAKIIARRIK